MHVDEVKVEKIRNASPPKKRKKFLSFLGRFIKDFAKIASPLTEKTSENVDF